MLSGSAPHRLNAVIPEWLVVDASPRFRDRSDAGRRLAEVLRPKDLDDAVVVGLARGGIVVAAEVASALHLALDVVAVRKVGHPLQPELAIGAVAPGDGVYLRGGDKLEPQERETVVQSAKQAAADLDRRLHWRSPPLDLRGRTALLVDDGLATGATMIAAARWARGAGAERVVAAVPVAAAQTIEVVSHEVDELVCPHPLEPFYAVGVWYESFEQVEDDEVIGLLEAARSAPPVQAGSPSASRSGPRPLPDASA
jgi:putative phosphoribosyl transferase